MMYNLTKTSATKSTYYRKVKLLVSLLIILSSFVLGKGFAGIGSDVPFSFTLQTDARTSAGVYTKDGVLIRTLWSGVSYKAGTYAMSWDGKDDYGHLYADGSYDVKVVSNNITATWDGVIGNSSGQLTGPSVHRGWETIRTMTATGNTLYYAKGYSEGSPSQTKFSSVTPQAKTSLLTSSGTGQATLFSATDGVNVYWAGYDAFAAVADSWFVFATKVADDSEYVFPKGAPYQVTRGYKYKSSIAAVEDVAVTGLAVQKGGNYLFIAYQDVNAILAFNKTTGEYIKTIELGAPVGNICVDKNDNLWVVLGSNKVQKYTAKADGSLLATTLSITGLSSPQALAVSPDGTTLLVADAADSQQLKAFSTTTAAPSWTYGRKGGYATDATVTNDKFYFLMGDTGRNAYLTYQADGSFWVGDSGNFRALHFSASRSLLDCVMYVPTCYSSSVDGTNPSRVFAGFLEFAVDYSKSLGAPTAPGNWSKTGEPLYRISIWISLVF
ncbi:FlgD immunoglobulin-like domain containing protein [Spirosoma sp. KNUC1025]|uniref:FlgD immunoglobulin-like domain containing protein n=1 Tax=Spirosoma sp. KNUC1025 TaxID=2894082 RepID=UPI00386BB46C|nr:DUF5711 family protein [Spirosoma sp. KNUC1025]